jgi:hypothetical protein
VCVSLLSDITPQELSNPDFRTEIPSTLAEEAYFLREPLRDVGQQSLFDCQRPLYYFRPSVETSILSPAEDSTYDLAVNPHSAITNRQFSGGGEGIRTPDPRVANAVLCQLSYTPDKKVVAGAGFEPATFGL